MIVRVRRVPRSVPLRLRLTLAFASVIGLVLAGVGALIYLEFAGYVDRRADSELSERAVAFRGLSANEVHPRRIVELSGEAYAQIYVKGRLVATTRALGTDRLLTATQLADAARRPVIATQEEAPGADDGVRLRAFSIDEGEVAVVAEPRDDRERELAKLATLLLIGLPGALVLASVAGYVVAGAALVPVERLRSRAEEISDADLDDRLPRPGTGDELDRLAETLNSMLGRLQGALEHERQIVGDASHELRTPIAVLRTRVDVAVRDRTLGADDLRDTLRAVQQDAVRLSRLADDLLLLARADQGALPLRLEPVEVEELLDTVAARHRPDAESTGRTIAVVPPSGGAVVLGDPHRLMQVLENLVVNALRYGEGTVELSGFEGPDRSTLCLAVSDQGSGFPPGFAERAFDRFSQADDSRGRVGSGLGLAIVAAIVRAHGGSVAVAAPVPGRDGARVVFDLPRA